MIHGELGGTVIEQSRFDCEMLFRTMVVLWDPVALFGLVDLYGIG